MIAAPGSSILPSRSRSRRLPPCRFQATIRSSICCACAFGALAPLSSRLSSGTVSIARTSWVAAAFIAAVTEASVHLPFLVASRSRFLLSRSTRSTEPLWPHSSSAAAKPFAVVWFQLVIVPSAGSMPCGWPLFERKPVHSYLPVPRVGRPGSTSRVAHRQQAGRVHRDVLVVDVERVERLRGERGRLHERLRRCAPGRWRAGGCSSRSSVSLP